MTENMDVAVGVNACPPFCHFFGGCTPFCQMFFFFCTSAHSALQQKVTTFPPPQQHQPTTALRRWRTLSPFAVATCRLPSQRCRWQPYTLEFCSIIVKPCATSSSERSSDCGALTLISEDARGRGQPSKCLCGENSTAHKQRRPTTL